MKLAILSKVLPPLKSNGGIGTYTWNLAKGLVSVGHEVHIFTSFDADYEKVDGLFVHVVKNDVKGRFSFLKEYPILSANMDYAYSLYLKFLEVHKNYGLDLVETPNWDIEGFFVLKSKLLPVVTRLHTPLIEVAEIENWDFTEDILASIYFEKYLIENSSALVYSTEAIKAEVIKKMEVDMDGVLNKKIPLGVELINDFKSKNLKRKDLVNVLFVGRLEKRKGIEVLLDVVPKLLAKYSNLKFSFVGRNDILNDFGETYMDAFLNANLEFKDRVSFKGLISFDELQDCYRNCDIFVAPSIFESFGLIYLEAFQYEKPVVASSVGGIVEVVEDKKTGLLVEPENAFELEKAMSALIDDEDLCLKLGKAGRISLEQKFSLSIMVKNVEDFYSDLIIGDK